MRSDLYQTYTLNWMFIVLSQWNNSPRIDMTFHSDTLSWFRANQSLFFLLNELVLQNSNSVCFCSAKTEPSSSSHKNVTCHEITLLTVINNQSINLLLIISIEKNMCAFLSGSEPVQVFLNVCLYMYCR
jgi:hypothetical protein